jgi:hypothetical protein
MRAPYRDDHDALMARLVALLDDLEGLRGRTRELRDVQRDTQTIEREIAGLRRQIERVAPTRLPLLDRVAVAAPCTADWDSMSGDDRARLCGQCDKHVYNLASMTAEEAEGFLRGVAGEVCIRVFRRADGTVLTSDCPVGVRRRRRRRAVASVVGGGLITAGALVATARLRPPVAAEAPALVTIHALPEPTETAPTVVAPRDITPMGGAAPLPNKELRIQAEMAHVRTVLERRAKMRDPVELRAAEAEIKAARERIAAISKSPH